MLVEKYFIYNLGSSLLTTTLFVFNPNYFSVTIGLSFSFLLLDLLEKLGRTCRIIEGVVEASFLATPYVVVISSAVFKVFVLIIESKEIVGMTLVFVTVTVSSLVLVLIVVASSVNIFVLLHNSVKQN
jgi:hypothetical protein